MHALIPLLATSVALSGPGITQEICKQATRFASAKKAPIILIAQKYGGEDPHGCDPHGEDPHDENHDKDLPANREQKKYKAPKDVYGGEIPNSREPY
jgi:hypothetical protein